MCCVLQCNRGRAALPIAVPTLNHLWTNLKTQLSPAEKENWRDNYPGYIMRIKCTWDYEEQIDRCLEIGLSLVNDRLFIRVTESNLSDGDHILNIVYLPTFAGVLPKENKATRAERRAYLGRGMAGSIIRNMIYDLYIEDINIRNTFYSELDIEPFSEDFHMIIKVNERKVVRNKKGELEILTKSKYTPRDIIIQGSGYLQWLSIFCILYSSNVDVLLLDEPYAHLHASLQSELLERLLDAVTEDKKCKSSFRHIRLK